MIVFFRKLRQTLLTQSKIAHYLLYALGEIVLVVIGILIALQINSWNEDRKDRIAEAGYYCKFLEDVKQDGVIIQTQLKETKNRLHAANIFLQNLQQKTVDTKALAFQMASAVTNVDFKLEPTKTAFEDLKSSGSLKIIKDLELKDKLVTYYSTIQGIMTVINENNIGISLRFKNNNDRLSTGWVYHIEKQDGFDSTLINLDDLKRRVGLTEETKVRLMNDGLVYIGTSSRNLLLFEELGMEVARMRLILEAKCKE